MYFTPPAPLLAWPSTSIIVKLRRYFILQVISEPAGTSKKAKTAKGSASSAERVRPPTIVFFFHYET